MEELCPMSILNQACAFLQTKVLPYIPLQHQKLFSFGFSALTLQSFTSLNGNARMTIENRSTAESKIYRLVSNKDITKHFMDLVSGLHLVSPGERINVDFSTFCGYQVLTFAKQTSLGRAIPVYIAAITYPIENPGSQTQFIIAEVKKFMSLLGFSVHLVFDRGFELPYLANSLTENHVNFTIRMKKDKHVLYMGKDIPLRNLPWFENDVVIGIYGKDIRVVRSEKLSERKDSEGKEEPWYLLTNDIKSTRDRVVADYYFRFEIEETFKDLKHVCELKSFYRIKKKQTFLVLLWFFMLSVWMAFLLEETKEYLSLRVTQNKHKKISIVRFFFEQISLEKNQLFCMSP